MTGHELIKRLQNLKPSELERTVIFVSNIDVPDEESTSVELGDEKDEFG